jgi:hypothetical protein
MAAFRGDHLHEIAFAAINGRGWIELPPSNNPFIKSSRQTIYSIGEPELGGTPAFNDLDL